MPTKNFKSAIDSRLGIGLTQNALNNAKRTATTRRLIQETNSITPTYIGGTPDEARAEFWRQEPVMQHAVDSIADRYGIDPDALKYRIDREGFTDTQIRIRNNPNFGAYRGYDLLHTMSGGVEDFGLDDVATYIKDGKVKPINEKWLEVYFNNEKGRETHGADGESTKDNIGLSAATLKYFIDTAKKDNPNISDYDANRYGLAYYNRGIEGGRKWVKNGAQGYGYRRRLESRGKLTK